jgi:transcription-repair coupling factor (superfamily II helicase)
VQRVRTVNPQRPSWFQRIALSKTVAQIAQRIARPRGHGPIALRGAAGSSSSVLAGAVMLAADRPLLLVTAHRDDADEAAAELDSIGVPVLLFPALEGAPDGQEAAELQAQRMRVLRAVDAADAVQTSPAPPGQGMPCVIVAPVPALMQGVPAEASMDAMMRTMRVGTPQPRDALVEWLGRAGYDRLPSAEQPASFAVRGGVIDVFPAGALAPVRLDFFGDELEGLFEVDPATQATDRRLDAVDLLCVHSLFDPKTLEAVAQRMPQGSVLMLAETAEIAEQSRAYLDRITDGAGVFPWSDSLRALVQHCHATIESGVAVQSVDETSVIDVPAAPLPAFAEALPEAIAQVNAIAEQADIAVLCDTSGDLQRARELLVGHGESVQLEQHHVHRGFMWQDGSRGLALLPWHEMLHRFGTRRRKPPTAALGGRSRDAFLSFDPGDAVVHRDHGIALYHGLVQMPSASGDGADEEHLKLEFDGNTILHVPASKVALVQRYVGAGVARPKLSGLGSKRWKRQKEEVAEAVRDLAGELLRVQAVRHSTVGIACAADSQWQMEFEGAFPFTETEDQVTAIAAVKRDMEATRPMDRLVCGDVGFGKTEVALRAAFKCAQAGRQVALLVPTTVLAEQHERTFRSRMGAFPFVIESVSRFRTDAEVRDILDRLAAGQVDIVIGTHRLLSADVRFRELGLVIIDEEQRFGVEHKQRLFEFRLTADVLTLTATPIPRTLHMAMLGLRDISSLTTPPPDRRAIVTEVIPYQRERLASAIARELARDGQVFWVHNRVHDILSAADEVRRLAPQARIVVGHGQMSDGELEDVMRRFMRHEADILVSTTIIESGIDIPSANTMIIDDAHRFGLSELHQLRGRVGRSSHRAYCYLLLPHDRTVTPEAMKRLRALEDCSMLGAGFKIAVRDLELRGAGNLLGREQSGHITSVGYEMYCRLLDHEVRILRAEPTVISIDTMVDIGLRGSLPRSYIPSDRRRLEGHRRLTDAASPEELERSIADLRSAYGDPPEEVSDLFLLSEVRLRLTMIGVRALLRREGDLIFRAQEPSSVQTLLRRARGSVRVVGSADEAGLTDVFWRPDEMPQPRSLLRDLVKRLRG